MLGKSRILLYPLSVVYGGVLRIRNFLFDKNFLKSASFNFPIICVGNLAVGGTGKTPMTEYLVELLRGKFKVATLSRGYKRKTKGFAIATSRTTANEIGDEPMQFHLKFPDITVAVGEERLVAIPQLLHERPETEVIILDDAFQHRQVRAGLNIVLTEYDRPYHSDRVLPAGNLRDVVSSAARADIIVVTKCPSDLTEEKANGFTQKLRVSSDQEVYFTHIVYASPLHLFNQQPIEVGDDVAVLLVCGIANPEPLKRYVLSRFKNVEILQYRDHHIFRTDDMITIKEKLEKMPGREKIVLTTEKDGVRLVKFRIEMEDFPIYVLPIRHEFLFNGASRFAERVFEYCESLPVKVDE